VSRVGGYGDRDRYRARHKANLPSTSKWALTNDWTVVLKDGPRAGTMRRAPLGPWDVLFGYRWTYFKNPNEPSWSDCYSADGYAPYQRVAFMRFSHTEQNLRIGLLGGRL
jgi:hypothetical protein